MARIGGSIAEWTVMQFERRTSSMRRRAESAIGHLHHVLQHVVVGVAVALLVVVGAAGAAWAQELVRISVPDIDLAEPGDQITVPITVIPGDIAVSGLNGQLRVDPTLLSAVSTSPTTGDCVIVDGVVRFAAIDAFGWTEPVEFCTVTFAAVGNGSGTLEAQVLAAFDPGPTRIEAENTTSLVQVGDAPSGPPPTAIPVPTPTATPADGSLINSLADAANDDPADAADPGAAPDDGPSTQAPAETDPSGSVSDPDESDTDESNADESDADESDADDVAAQPDTDTDTEVDLDNDSTYNSATGEYNSPTGEDDLDQSTRGQRSEGPDPAPSTPEGNDDPLPEEPAEAPASAAPGDNPDSDTDSNDSDGAAPSDEDQGAANATTVGAPRVAVDDDLSGDGPSTGLLLMAGGALLGGGLALDVARRRYTTANY